MGLAMLGLALALGVGGDTLNDLPVAGVLFAGRPGGHVRVLRPARRGAPAIIAAPVVLGVAAPAAAMFWTLTFAPMWAFPTAR